MMKKTLLISASVFALSSQLLAQEKKSMLKWFTAEKCVGFEIQQRVSISDPTITSKKLVMDADAAQKLMRRISALPLEGEMMISFAGGAEELVVVFNCGEKKESIHFIARAIKTPGTSFYFEANKEADRIFQDMNTLLLGEYGEPVLKIVHLGQDFPDFKITYTGKEFVDGKPATFSFSRELFLVKDKSGTEQRVTVTSGQVSPQPVKFKVNNHEYTLFTNRSPSGEDLSPDYIQINK